jgi:hypothetical protein
LVLGNSKLGFGLIWQFSIPARKTCPGKSKLCDRLCYAANGFFRMKSVKGRLAKNLRATRDPGFVDDVVAQIRRGGIRVVRIHVSGDFFSPEYAEKWVEIVKRCPDTTFFLYSRSWRCEDIRPALVRMAARPNVRMWWSCDGETGIPEDHPPRVRLAYMAVGDESPAELPGVSLAFRTEHTSVRKRIAGVLVCPAENGIGPKNGDITCSRCRICFDQARMVRAFPTTATE